MTPSTFEIYNQKFKGELVTIGKIYEIMGPVRTGEVVKSVYSLNYPDKGIKFIFKIPNKDMIKEISMLKDLPFKLSDGSTLVLSEIVIFKQVNVVNQGIKILENKITIKDKEFDFSDSLVEILREIGKPDFEYYKNSSRNFKVVEVCWVYSELGLEIIKDLGKDEIRLVLHYNIPGHWDFGKFRKCLFRLKRGSVEFTQASEFKELKKLLNAHGLGSPVVVNKSKSGFGSTWSYAFSFGVIVQVSGMDQIVSIIITKV
jgi:hypothetical protein